MRAQNLAQPHPCPTPFAFFLPCTRILVALMRPTSPEVITAFLQPAAWSSLTVLKHLASASALGVKGFRKPGKQLSKLIPLCLSGRRLAV